MQVSCDGEQPGAKPGIRSQAAGVFHEPQPSFLEQVLGNIPPVR